MTQGRLDLGDSPDRTSAAVGDSGTSRAPDFPSWIRLSQNVIAFLARSHGEGM